MAHELDEKRDASTAYERLTHARALRAHIEHTPKTRGLFIGEHTLTLEQYRLEAGEPQGLDDVLP